MRRSAAAVELAWLLKLRWVGYLCLLLLLTSVERLARIHVDYVRLSALLAVGALSNAVAQWRGGRDPNASAPARVTLILLSVDVAVLSGVLALLGGPANPLVLAYLVPLVVAGASLARLQLWILVGITLAALALVAWFHAPLLADHSHVAAAAHEHAAGQEMLTEHHAGAAAVQGGQHVWMHVRGLWLMLAAMMVLVAYLLHWAFDQRDAQLARLRADVERSAQVMELSALAAGAAHELGTPLATIAIVAREMTRHAERGDVTHCARDARVIEEQVARCRQVLSLMSNESRAAGQQVRQSEQLLPFLQEARERCSDPERVQVLVPRELEHCPANVPRALLLQVLCSLIENALDASHPTTAVILRGRAIVAGRSAVSEGGALSGNSAVDAQDVADSWTIEVEDRGPGLSDEQLSRVGHEPFSSKPSGMGIGLFLGRAVLDRLSGSLRLSSSEHGTRAILQVPCNPDEATIAGAGNAGVSA